MDLSTHGFRAVTHLRARRRLGRLAAPARARGLSRHRRLGEGQLCRLPVRAAASSGGARNDRSQVQGPLRPARGDSQRHPLACWIGDSDSPLSCVKPPESDGEATAWNRISDISRGVPRRSGAGLNSRSRPLPRSAISELADMFASKAAHRVGLEVLTAAQRRIGRAPAGAMVLPVRIELTTSALPRMRSTTELRQPIAFREAGAMAADLG